MLFLLLNIISFFVSLLGYRGIYFLSKTLSYLSFDILKIRRSIILQNLDIAFGDSKSKKEKKEIARKSMSSFIATILEFIAARKLFPKAKINLVNSHYVNDAIGKNKGVYAMCIHMSNWELLCHVGSATLAPVHVVVKPIGKGKLALWVENLRREIGYSLIDRKGKLSATTQIFKAIDEREIVGFIVDQKRSRGENLPFFGRIASSNNSLVKLYLRKKAPIIPAIIKRTGIGQFDIIFFKEFVVNEDKQLSFAQQVTENTLRINKQVEQMILQNPSEYFWMHNRWDLKK